MALTPATLLRRQAAELIQLADELDRAASAPAPGRDQFFLDTSKAAKIARRSSSWLYANGKRFKFGWQLQSGCWAFSESRLRAFLTGGHTSCEKSELYEKTTGRLSRFHLNLAIVRGRKQRKSRDS